MIPALSYYPITRKKKSARSCLPKFDIVPLMVYNIGAFVGGILLDLAGRGSARQGLFSILL